MWNNGCADCTAPPLTITEQQYTELKSATQYTETKLLMKCHWLLCLRLLISELLSSFVFFNTELDMAFNRVCSLLGKYMYEKDNNYVSSALCTKHCI